MSRKLTPPPFGPLNEKKAGSVWLRALIIVVVAVGVGFFYWWFDPMQSQWMPQCVFKRLTGFECMGCGSQRMIHALVHGHFAEALRANALLFISIPFLVFGLWVEINRCRNPRLYAKVYSKGVIVAVGVILLLWTVLRNLLSFPFAS